MGSVRKLSNVSKVSKGLSKVSRCYTSNSSEIRIIK